MDVILAVAILIGIPVIIVGVGAYLVDRIFPAEIYKSQSMRYFGRKG